MSGVINAAGHLSSLGGSLLSAAVREAMDRAGREFVDMSRLVREAEAEVAAACAAEGACITAGAAAGIAISVAACVTGGEPGLAGRAPKVRGRRREIVAQAGHLINFGAPVAQMVTLGGGVVREAGSAAEVTRKDLEGAFRSQTAGFLWVQSHHTRDNASLPLVECLAAARRHGVPFIMDCAAEEDLRAFTEMGADLVIYSGTKAIGAPVSGFIAGKEPYAGWCRAQSRGIARSMKVGKEQVAGLLAALREYVVSDPAAEQARQSAVLSALEAGLSGLGGIRLERVRDEAGRPIERLAIRQDEGQARALAAALQMGEPAVYTRPHRLAEGLVQFDPRCISGGELAAIVQAVSRAWGEAGPAA